MQNSAFIHSTITTYHVLLISSHRYKYYRICTACPRPLHVTHVTIHFVYSTLQSCVLSELTSFYMEKSIPLYHHYDKRGSRRPSFVLQTVVTERCHMAFRPLPSPLHMRECAAVLGAPYASKYKSNQTKSNQIIESPIRCLKPNPYE